MKKILLILIGIGMILITVSCGYNVDGESVLSGSNENLQLNVNKEYFEILEGTNFCDGVAFVDIRKDGEEVVVAINNSGEILFELEECYSTIALSNFENGLVVFENIAYNKNGKVASPELQGYDEICYIGAGNFRESGPVMGNKSGHIIVKKFEETYAGAVTLFGVIDNEGKWEIPLSENGQWECGEITYSWGGGRVTDYKTTYSTEEYVRYTDKFGLERMGYAIHKHEVSGDTLILKDYHAEYFMDETFIGSQTIWDEQGNYLRTEYMLYDYQGNSLLDLSEFETRISITTAFCDQRPDYKDGHLLFEAHNNNGTFYLYLLNTQGEFVYEPIKLDSSDKCYGLNEKGFLLQRNSVYYLYEYSGNIIQYDEEIYTLSEFSDGLALAENDWSQKMYINYEGEVIIKQAVEK